MSENKTGVVSFDGNAVEKTAKPDRPLNPREERFCLAYLATSNGAEAVRRAGYSARSAHSAAQRGHELMKDSRIRTRIDEAIAKVRESYVVELTAQLIDARELHQFLTDAIRADIGEIKKPDGTYKPWTEWPAIHRKNVLTMDVKEDYERPDQPATGRVIQVKFLDKARLVELAGRLAAVAAFKEADEKHFHIGNLSQASTEDLISLLKEIDGQIGGTRTIETPHIH